MGCLDRGIETTAWRESSARLPVQVRRSYHCPAASRCALARLLELPMVALERGLNWLAIVDDVAEGTRQGPIDLGPMGHVWSWQRMCQGFLDSREVGGLPGFDSAIGIATKRRPA